MYFITGTAYAGKSTMVKLLSEKYMAYENSGFFTMIRTNDRAISGALKILEKHVMLESGFIFFC